MWFIVEPFRRRVQRTGMETLRAASGGPQQRRGLGTMNHIAPSPTSRCEPPESVLMGQDHRTLV